ncbi:MAG: succinate dehydrogenase, cytochrome b556 subunit [Firmicutes bacterium]|jgi:succinate dehydrogenase / fumarate reductase cytochrome b subunit|nr:succinate dehydrogenase, cytochrome b556 subunit [Bacillota bacterium]
MYRGREGMWSWILHRVTGVAVLLFLFAHILDTMLLLYGPDVYNTVVGIYHNKFFLLMEVALVAAVIYHAVNGLRIIIIDVWPAATRHQRKLFWGAVAVIFAMLIPAAWQMLQPLFEA